MTPTSQLTSETERTARQLWLVNASDHRFALCDGCGRAPVLVARQGRSRRWQCQECWEDQQ